MEHSEALRQIRALLLAMAPEQAKTPVLIELIEYLKDPCAGGHLFARTDTPQIGYRCIWCQEEGGENE